MDELLAGLFQPNKIQLISFSLEIIETDNHGSRQVEMKTLSRIFTYWKGLTKQ